MKISGLGREVEHKAKGAADGRAFQVNPYYFNFIRLRELFGQDARALTVVFRFA